MKRLSALAIAALLSALAALPAAAAETGPETADGPEADTITETESVSGADGAAAPLEGADGALNDEAMSDTAGLTDSTSLFAGISEDDFMDSVKASVLSGGLFTSSEYLDSIGAIDTTFDSLYDLSSLGVGNVDTGYLNLAYESMVDAMNTTFDSIDLSGQSVSCMDLFSEKFGDVLDSVSISYAELPSGFDVWSMLDSASDSVASAYSSATNTGSFASYKDSIDISSIFAQAAAGPTTYDLSLSSDLISWLDSGRSYYSGVALGEYNSASSGWSSEFETAKKGYVAAASSFFGTDEDGNSLTAKEARDADAATYQYNSIKWNPETGQYEYDTDAMAEAAADASEDLGDVEDIKEMNEEAQTAYYRELSAGLFNETTGGDSVTTVSLSGFVNDMVDAYNKETDDNITGWNKLMTKLNIRGTTRLGEDAGVVSNAIGKTATGVSNFFTSDSFRSFFTGKESDASKNTKKVLDAAAEREQSGTDTTE